ncbi:MAG: hypothetical protein AVDCRST_MAG62-196 [uncultured Sphingomonas sp.]|uniref:Sulfotransferase n=1 Tax=uncultured Sphingomonas sp. TaxID=158754 RepID=A0A6J4SU70_9SPHN|nr:MAG: hypothetical protein AVDCRST_MAG62-196 [uncultured Sphingomonas sp.]
MSAPPPPWPPLVAIVGAPRCGTTSLADFLRKHPDVVFSVPKEPHYFAIHDLTGTHGEELSETVRNGYLDRFFPGFRADAQWLAEGSVSYLYGAEQMAPILELWPGARFVLGVRDPMKLVSSLHQRYLVTGDETEEDFEQAWALIPDRSAGRKVPRSCLDPRLLRYDVAGRLGEQVERFFAAVGRERCHVVVHDDLVADPARVYAELLAFLDLRHDGRTQFRPKRAAEGYRFGWLQRLLKRPPVATSVLAGEKFRRRVVSKPKRSTPFALRKLQEGRKALLRWNKAPSPAIRLSRDMQQRLRTEFADDVAHLGRLIGRDLSHWLALSDQAV